MKLLNRCGQCACSLASNNPVAVQLIGLCPILATTTSIVKAVAMALMLMATMLVAGCIAAMLRSMVLWQLKPLYFCILSATAASAVIAITQLSFPALIDALGIYPYLLAANCLVMSMLQEYAEHKPVTTTAGQALYVATAVALILVAMAVVRESLGYGALGHDAYLISGIAVASEPLADGLVPMMAAPPGAFFLARGGVCVDERHSPALAGGSDCRILSSDF